MIALTLVAAAVVVYTWLLYPLVVGLLSLIRRRPMHATSPTLPPVSVIVASREDDSAVQARISDLARTRYPHGSLEIVVALDHHRPLSADGSLSSPGCSVRVVRGDPPGGKAAAVNAGVRASTGEILVFADTAQSFDRSAIPALVAALKGDPRLAAVSGALHEPADDHRRGLTSIYWRMERWLRQNEARVHSSIGVTGAIYAMRRELWSPLPAGLILDDLFVPMRLVLEGHRVGFEAGAIARETRRFSPEDEFRRKTRTLTGVLQLCAWLPGVLSPFRNPVWMQFVSHKLLRMATPYLLALVTIGVLWKSGRSMSGGIASGLLLLGFALVAVLVSYGPSRRLLREAMLMQASIVRATGNAVRGDWDVWR